MSSARLPDGSRIVAAHHAAPDARLWRLPNLDVLLHELRVCKRDPFVMEALRRLRGTGDLRPAADDELLRQVAYDILGGRLAWELPPLPAPLPIKASAPAALEPAEETKRTESKPTSVARAGAPAPPIPRPTSVRPAPAAGAGAASRPPIPPAPLPRIKVVPELKPEYAVVLLAPGEPTYVQCSLKQDPAAPPFEKGARLSAKGAGDVEAYEDEKLTKRLDLSKPLPLKAPLKVWLKGVKKGLFDLALEVEDPADDRFERGEAAVAAMGVVELKLALHKQDLGSIAGIRVDPDTDPVSKYHDDLKAVKWPEQIEVTDAEKAQGTRWLHVQRGGSHARAKLVLRKLDAAAWPAAADDYRIVLSQKEARVALFEVEQGGKALPPPYAFKVSELKAAEKVLWLEGAAASKALGDVRLDLGLDRAPGGPAKKPKRDGDVARLTVVEIAEVKLEFFADSGSAEFWDGSRFFINTNPQSEREGRTLKDNPTDGKHAKVTAHLSEKIAQVPIHFMLAAPAANADASRWTQNFQWGKLADHLKAADKADRHHFLHVCSATGSDGVATTADLVLSRLGGDKFQVGAYLDQDAHLARYVPDVPDLSNRKPALSGEIQIWRRIWAQITRNAATALPSRAQTRHVFSKAFVDYREIDETTFGVGSALNLIEYERWQFEPGGGHDKIVCVGNHNKSLFHAFFKSATPDTTPKSHFIVCDAQWDPAKTSWLSWITSSRDAQGFALDRNSNELGVVVPPLDGRLLVLSGHWEWNDGTTLHSDHIQDSQIAIEPTRTSASEFKVILPTHCSSLCPCGGGAEIDISPQAPAEIVNLRLNAAVGPFLGESGQPHCLIVSTANPRLLDNEIIHEVGHQFGQVRAMRNWHGVPDHLNHYEGRGGQGPHCRRGANEDRTRKDRLGRFFLRSGSCVMFHSPASSLFFCPDCSTDLRVRDLSGFNRLS